MERARQRYSTRSLTLCALFAALIAIGAFIRIPIPVVPFTLQFLFTTLAGLLLGPRLGAASVVVYTVLGLIGLPVFTQGGGPGYIFQPTFGYILGFCIGTYYTGKIAEAVEYPSFLRLLVANFVGLTIVYLFGMIYYYFIANYYLQTPIGVGALIFYCCLVTVPGDIAITFGAAYLVKRLWPIWRGDVGR